jgi:hypothetical protein
MSARPREHVQEPVEDVPWRWPVVVRCPRCRSRATVAGGHGAPVRLTCGACSLVREWDGEALFAAGVGGEVVRLPRARGTGQWLDPQTSRLWARELRWPAGRDEYFGADLWLQTECCGGRLLWARNAEHLDYLRAFVAGELRGDAPAATYTPLSSKLPTWMKEAKHRDAVLRHIDRLRRTLD